MRCRHRCRNRGLAQAGQEQGNPADHQEAHAGLQGYRVGRANQIGEEAGLQFAQRVGANCQNQNPHRPTAHLIAGGEQDDRTLHTAKAGLADTHEK